LFELLLQEIGSGVAAPLVWFQVGHGLWARSLTRGDLQGRPRYPQRSQPAQPRVGTASQPARPRSRHGLAAGTALRPECGVAIVNACGAGPSAAGMGGAFRMEDRSPGCAANLPWRVRRTRGVSG
jgi:hypothetical protein